MSFDFAKARQMMVDSQVRPADVTDYCVTDAMRVVERERLLPPERQALAYADAEVPYAPGRALMRPRDAGKLLQAVKPRPGERALAIAAPYLAAVMQQIGLEVVRVDGEDLTRVPAGQFDVIVCEGAVSAVPASWLKALAPGGRLAAVERLGPAAKAVVYLHGETGIGRREAFDASAPLLPGFEPKKQFAF